MNKLPIPFDQLDSRAVKAIEGLKALGEAIGVKQNSDAVLSKALKQARARETAFQASYVKRQRELTPALTAAEKDAQRFFNSAKKILKLSLSERWTPQWAEVGFVSGTIRTPGLQQEREALLLALGAYFKANPQREVEGLQVTAARALEVHAALSSARAARDAHDLAHQKLGSDRRDATETLRKRLRGLLGELNTLLPKTDARWTAFGFAPPSVRKRGKRKSPGAAAAAASPGQELVSLDVQKAA